MAGLSDGSRGQFIYWDMVVSAMAIAANIIIFCALRHRKFKPNSYRWLLINLSICDVYFSAINLLRVVYEIIGIVMAPGAGSSNKFDDSDELETPPPFTEHPYFRCVANALRTLQLAGLFANLFNLCSMSVDHLLGVKYPVRYRQTARNKFAATLIASTWLISFSLAFADIPANLVLFSEDGTVTDFVQFSGKENKNTSKRIFIPNKFQPRTRSLLTTVRTFLPNLKGNETFLLENSKFPSPGYQPVGLLEDFLSVVPDDVLSAVAGVQISKNNSKPIHSNQASINSKEKAVDANFQSDSSFAEKYRYCTLFSVKKIWFELCVIAMVAICFVLLIACYGVIFRHVTGSLATADATGRRTKRLIFTTVTFLAAFTICWIPFVLAEFLLFILSNNLSPSEEAGFFQVQKALYSLLLMYPLFDPIIYACRVPAVQEFLFGQCVKHFAICQRFIVQSENNNNIGDDPKPSKALLDSPRNNHDNLMASSLPTVKNESSPCLVRKSNDIEKNSEKSTE